MCEMFDIRATVNVRGWWGCLKKTRKMKEDGYEKNTFEMSSFGKK